MGLTRRRRRARLVLTSILLAVVAAILVPAAVQAVAVIDERDTDAPEAFDSRPVAAASTAVRGAASSLSGAEVSYDRFGSPRMLVDHDGWLASGYGGDAVAVAREFLRDNAAAFGFRRATSRISSSSTTRS